MRRTAVVLALVLTGPACGGDSNPTGPSPTPTATRFTLSGRITDAGTSAAVSGASVTVVDGPAANRTALSGADGRYSLTDIERSGFTARIRRDGYAEEHRPVNLVSDVTLDVALSRFLTGADWRGTLDLTLNGARASSGVASANLTQSGNDLAGLIAVNNGANATISGTVVAGRFDGTMRFDSGSSDPAQRCTGVAANLTGPATSTAITLTAPRLALDFCRGDVTDVELRLTR